MTDERHARIRQKVKQAIRKHTTPEPQVHPQPPFPATGKRCPVYTAVERIDLTKVLTEVEKTASLARRSVIENDRVETRARVSYIHTLLRDIDGVL